MEKVCANPNCKKVFYKQVSDSRKYWEIKRFCSITCSGTTFKKGRVVSEEEKKRLSNINKGSNNHWWKGGKRTTSQGYIEVLISSRKYQLEHRYIMEQHLGRKLSPIEHVHHLNGDKTDNRLENLRLIDRKEHGLAHAHQRWHGSSVSDL
jgi:hypothetical protein